MTISQYFVYKRPIAWTLLISTMVWRLRGLPLDAATPGPADPGPARRGLRRSIRARTPIEVEQEVSRKIEKKMTENPAVEHVRSLSRQGLSAVFVDLYDTTQNAEAVWQDLDNKLASMTDLPPWPTASRSSRSSTRTSATRSP